MMKIKKIINKYIHIDKKYNITLYVSSITFYSILSVSALAILVILIINYTNEYFSSFLLTQILEIVSETFTGLLNDALLKLSTSSINIFLVISVIYSLSSIINRFNKFSDTIYQDIPKRNAIRLRVSSIAMFLMLVVIFILELVIVFYSKYFVQEMIINKKIANLLINTIEIMMFYIFVVLINMYFPPCKMRFKSTYFISLIETILIYVCLFLFKTFFYIIFLNSKIIGITYVFTIFGFLLFIINYIIALGIILIKKYGKK